MAAGDMIAMNRRPWMKWYPADWRADPKLRMCSLAARGLWADMLALMHEAEPYGHLLIAGRAPTEQQLGALVGATGREAARLLAELGDAGVYSRTNDGTIYSRRMLRDNEKAARDADNGKRGGNPKLIDDDKRGVNPPVNVEDKAHKPEARSQRLEAASAEGSSAPAAAAAANPLFALQDACLARMGLTASTAPPGLANGATLRGWLDAGADAADIIAAVGATVTRQRAKKPDWLPGSWAYFATPLAEYRQARAAGLSAVNGAAYAVPPAVTNDGRLSAPGRWYDGMTPAERDAEVARRREADEAEQRRVRDEAAERASRRVHEQLRAQRAPVYEEAGE